MTVTFDENGNCLGLKPNGNPKEPNYVVWKETPYEEHFFTSTNALKIFLQCGEAKLQELLECDIVWHGWKVDELVREKYQKYKRKTNRVYNRKKRGEKNGNGRILEN